MRKCVVPKRSVSAEWAKGRARAHLLEVGSPYAVIWDEGPRRARHSGDDFIRLTAALNWTVEESEARSS
jgi:hypothetical protein